MADLIAKRVVAFLLGVRDGWRQPLDLSTSTNVDHLATASGDVQEVLDRGINVGQMLRGGRRSQAWQEGYWPRPPLAEHHAVLPLPNDTTPHGVVIASVWLNDDPHDEQGNRVTGDFAEGPAPFALLMVLHPEAPYYNLYEITWRKGVWHFRHQGSERNINLATERYADQGGDY